MRLVDYVFRKRDRFSFMLGEEPTTLQQVNAEPHFRSAWSTSLARLLFSLPFSSSALLPSRLFIDQLRDMEQVHPSSQRSTICDVFIDSFSALM